MPNPKRRHSRARTGKRRAHDYLVEKGSSVCESCGQPVLPHRVCPYCGKYKGREVIEVESD